MKNKKTIIISIIIIVGVIAAFYLCGFIAQVFANYADWKDAGGFIGDTMVKPIDWNPLTCIAYVFTLTGLKVIIGLAIIGGLIFAIYKLYDRFDGKDRDDRGFTKNKTGTYGTASMMSEREMKEVLKLHKPEDAEGVILGEYKGKVVCMPKDTDLNRNIAIVGSSGTMKSRAIIRNALLQALKQGESIVVTDPKGEMYADTAELYRQNGYEVKVFNLVDPEHSDSWNCMARLKENGKLAQVLTSVIIGNTSSGQGDHFWDNGESNFLKALILYVDEVNRDNPQKCNLPFLYDLLGESHEDINAKFMNLPPKSKALKPYNIYKKSGETVKTGVTAGLGGRLQILQNDEVRDITTSDEIDLTLPGKKKCAYFMILSDQDKSMAFLSSLFFSFFFIELVRYADSQSDRRCAIPVNFILDEFNNIGKIGGAEDGSDFAKTLSTCRSRGIRVMLAIQSISQLQNRYPDKLWGEILGNCDIHLMLGCTDEDTAKFFSNRCGEMTVDVNTTMTMRRTLAIAQIIPQYRSQEGIGRRKVMTPDEILRLPQKEMLCIVRGYNALKLNKWDYTNHPLASQIVESSIADYTPERPKMIEESPKTVKMPGQNRTKPKKEVNKTIMLNGESVDTETGEILSSINRNDI